MRQINQDGVDFIKQHEGCKLKAYKDGGGTWTIGYGSTRNVKEGDVITESQAEAFLRRDLAIFQAGVEIMVKVPINDNEFNSLVDFVYNLGLHSLGTSTLLRLLNQDNKASAAKEFLKWDRIGARVVEGLLQRRKDEMELFLRPVSQS